MGHVVAFPLARRLLTPSDGQETVLCGLCFALVHDAGDVVIFDTCDACEVVLLGNESDYPEPAIVANDQAPERA